MSGRGITAETSVEIRPWASIRACIATRVDVGAGTSSVCMWLDRLVLQALSQADIAAISSGEHQMDAFVRRYIHQNLRYRFPDNP